MKKKKLTAFDESLFMNNRTYDEYLWRLTELAICSIKWDGFPETVDTRYLELQLFEKAGAIYFNDDVLGDLCLNFTTQGRMDVYGNPVLRRAYSSYNNYYRLLKPNNSVIIWNNYLRQPSYPVVLRFARMLYLLDMIVAVNANAQKTPVLISGSEQQRLTLINLYKEYAGNMPFIFGDKNLDLNSIQCLQTGAPFVAEQVYQLKTQIWNECLTYLGISNVAFQKKERMVSDEVLRSMGGTFACRRSRLEPRRIAAEKINRMFGLNVSVDYAEDESLISDTENGIMNVGVDDEQVYD